MSIFFCVIPKKSFDGFRAARCSWNFLKKTVYFHSKGKYYPYCHTKEIKEWSEDFKSKYFGFPRQRAVILSSSALFCVPSAVARLPRMPRSSAKREAFFCKLSRRSKKDLRRGKRGHASFFCFFSADFFAVFSLRFSDVHCLARSENPLDKRGEIWYTIFRWKQKINLRAALWGAVSQSQREFRLRAFFARIFFCSIKIK